VLVGVALFIFNTTVGDKAATYNSESSTVESDSQPKGNHQETFLEQFVLAGGPIVWFVLLPLSLITVFLAVEHCLIIRRKILLPPQNAQKIVALIEDKGWKNAVGQIKTGHDFISKAFARAMQQSKGDFLRTRSLISESLQEHTWLLIRKIEWLSLIGNVSPMVGLFGTVFGMIKLFNAIVMAGGQPRPGQLADGISVALVTTFWGLFIAIPALAMHGILRNRIETIVSEAVTQTENVMPMLRESLKKKDLTNLNRRKIQNLNKNPIPVLETRPAAKTKRSYPVTSQGPKLNDRETAV